ncbi:MAG: hypothetical protein ACK5HY_03045, partial [Parahaliea sp.]
MGIATDQPLAATPKPGFNAGFLAALAAEHGSLEGISGGINSHWQQVTSEGIGSVSGSDIFFSSADHKLHIVARGNFDWHDPVLAELARENGHGAALYAAYTRDGQGLLRRLAGCFGLLI